MLVAPTELPFHIEGPVIGALVLVKGAFIGLLLTKEEGIDVEGQAEVQKAVVSFEKEDVASRKKCSVKGLGEWTANYEEGVDTHADVDTWRQGEWTITFEKVLKLMDT